MTPTVCRRPERKRLTPHHYFRPAAEMQARVHGQAMMGFMGQFSVPAAYRRNLHDVLEIGLPVLWNVARAER